MSFFSNNSDCLFSISSSGDCMACCTPDGVVKFYDTITSKLKLEYSSSSNLQANCTCLSWSKLMNTENIKETSITSVDNKQKKIKHSTDSLILPSFEKELENLNLIAIGTSQGVILLFSLSKAELYSELSDESHADKINSISWCPLFTDSLYSCSDDGYIIEWSIKSSNIKSKWKASKTSVTSISINPNGQYIVSSSKSITIWNLNTRTKLKTLTGHSNDIFKLEFIKTNKCNEISQRAFFLSAALNDRIINFWSFNFMKIDDSEHKPQMSFSINEPPVFFETLSIIKNDTILNTMVLVTTQNGQLYIFNNDFSDEDKLLSNNNLKKPVKASNFIKIETKEGHPLKIYGAFVVNSNNDRLNLLNIDKKIQNCNQNIADLLKNSYLYITYGSPLALKIEKLSFSEINEYKKVLIRESPSLTSVYLQMQNIKIEKPHVSKDLKVLIPGQLGPTKNNIIYLAKNSNKRKLDDKIKMTLEERLNVMELNSYSNEKEIKDIDIFFKNGQVPRTDNLLVLLVQGLQSNDAKMLNHVFQHKNDKVINKTIRLIPSIFIVQLIRELNKRLQGHAQSGLGLLKWLKSVLMIHASYLMSYPDLIESLETVYVMMNARTKLFPQLSKLQGKLQLIMSQVSSQAQDSNENEKESLIFYQDSTSEDEQIEDEIIPSHSEFDEYVFSEDEDEDESNHEDIEESDEFSFNLNGTKKGLKKEIYKKSKVKKQDEYRVFDDEHNQIEIKDEDIQKNS